MYRYIYTYIQQGLESLVDFSFRDFDLSNVPLTPFIGRQESCSNICPSLDWDMPTVAPVNVCVYI